MFRNHFENWPQSSIIQSEIKAKVEKNERLNSILLIQISNSLKFDLDEYRIV